MQRSLPYLALFGAALLLPLFSNDYWAVIGARAAVYWVLVGGLNLVVGYGGQLAIGVVLLFCRRHGLFAVAGGNYLDRVGVVNSSRRRRSRRRLSRKPRAHGSIGDVRGDGRRHKRRHGVACRRVECR